MTEFELRQEHGPGVCVVALDGDLDMAVAPQLQESLQQALESGCAQIVLDLAAVTYLDSSALGLLVWLDHQLRPRGGRLVLAGASRNVSRIVELSGLTAVADSITLVSDVNAAMESLEPREEYAEPSWSKRVEFSADVRRLAEVREEVAAIVAAMGFSEGALFDIKVALGEALANAVRHGSPDEGDNLVAVDVLAYPDRVELHVMDSGVGFDGSDVENMDLYAPGGRGVMFMRALMDDVQFSRSGLGGTQVVLVKRCMVAQDQ